MKLPTRKQCLQMLKDYALPRNIIEHTKGVTKVAATVAKAMKKKGYDVNAELVERAALLHDIMKIARLSEKDFLQIRMSPAARERWVSLRKNYGNIGHAQSACMVLKDKWPELAKVVGSHNWSSMEHPQLLTQEQKILNYADKRYEDDCTVLLKERFNSFAARYPSMMSQENVVRINNNYFKLEKQIFKNLDITPEDIMFKSKWQQKKTTTKPLE